MKSSGPPQITSQVKHYQMVQYKSTESMLFPAEGFNIAMVDNEEGHITS